MSGTISLGFGVSVPAPPEELSDEARAYIRQVIEDPAGEAAKLAPVPKNRRGKRRKK